MSTGVCGVQELQENYEEELLSYLPNPDDSLASALLYAVLSSHAPNEEYLDYAKPQWIEVLLTPEFVQLEVVCHHMQQRPGKLRQWRSATAALAVLVVLIVHNAIVHNEGTTPCALQCVVQFSEMLTVTCY